MNKLGAVMAACCCSVLMMGMAPVTVDEAFPSYQRARGVSGSLKSMGSDTMNNVMAQLAAVFNRFYPNVQIEIEGKGSSTAPPALMENQAQFGPMSRPMRSSEIDEFERRFGFPPTLLRVGIDCLAVYVHRDNPVREISMEQITRAFSVRGPDMTWGDLGVDEPGWADRPLSLYGRNSASGTYDFFKQFALGGADFKSSVKEQPGSSGVVQAVGRDRYAIGYSGIGYKTAAVRAVPIVVDGHAAASPDYQSATSGQYPLARFLLVYVNFDERQGLDPLRREFIRMVYSRQGQEAIIREGYYPVGPETAREDLRKVGIEPSF